jgi:putative ABC transport system permease protein
MDKLSWFWRDLRFGARNIRKDQRFSSLAIFALALGIGATTIMFSVIYNLLFDPFPYKGADRLTTMTIHDEAQAGERGRSGFYIAELLDYRQQNHVFEDIVGSYDLDVLYTGNNDTRIFPGAYVTANTFDFFGVPALIGRGLTLEDGKPGAPPVFVMNYKLWNGQFKGDSGIVGKTFVLNGRPTTLVGIMPPRFQAYGMRIWLPLDLSPSALVTAGLGDAPIRFWAIGRLKPGVSLDSAAADLTVVAQRLSRLYPKDYPKQFSMKTKNVQEFVMGKFRTMLYALLGAVTMLLLIACSNVANLLLARATVREKEIAIRCSMGATPGRLVRQLLVESFLLALLAGVVGCVFAYFGIKGVIAIIPQGPLPDEAVISLNPIVLLFSLGVTIATTVLCGLAPALHAVRKNFYTQLSGSGKGSGTGYRHGHFRAALVTFEVALSIVLLVGAGLMMRSFVALTHVDLGLNPATVSYAQLAIPKTSYGTAQQKKVFVEKVLQQVRNLPGVISVSKANSIPTAGGSPTDVQIQGKTHSERWPTLYEFCSPDYFKTLELRTVAGRLLTETEVDSAQTVAVVNETLVRKYFGSEDPIGRKIHLENLDRMPDAPHGVDFDIVGVVSDFKNRGAQESPLPQVFVPYTISATDSATLVIRSAVDPNSLTSSIRQKIREIDPNVALNMSGTIKNYLKEVSYPEPEFGFVSLSAFAILGLILVAIGAFSVMAYTVSLQTHDFGVRMALGAQQKTILQMVLLNGMRLLGVGVLVGLVGSFVLSRFLATQVWGVSVNDPLTFLGVTCLVMLVGLAACMLPARRATRVDPLVALHYE